METVQPSMGRPCPLETVQPSMGRPWPLETVQPSMGRPVAKRVSCIFAGWLVEKSET